MIKKAKVLFTGTGGSDVDLIESYIRAQSWFVVSSKYLRPNETVAWARADDPNRPDIVVVFVAEGSEAHVNNVASGVRGDAELIVIGPAGHAALMRQAMRSGAHDYIEQPVSKEELCETLRLVARQRSSASGGPNNVTTVVNTKGGSGASFIAANLAHIYAAQDKLQTALLDLDFQFGIQSLNFNVELEHGLNEVLASIDKLDAVALKGHMAKHGDSLFLLGEKLDPVVLPSDLNVNGIDRAMALLAQAFDQIVVDLPRNIDPLFSSIISRSTHVVLVTQQSVAHIRDAKRLLSILRNEFDITPEQITVAVNRFSDKTSISEKDIEQTLNFSPVTLIPNDFRRVAASTNTASPLLESAPGTPISKALVALARKIRGNDEKPKTLLGRALSGLFGH